MADGYTKAFSRITGDTILASDFNTEFQSLDDAFDASGGHRHDNTASQGGYVPLISDLNNYNSIEVDTGNDEWDFNINVSNVKTRQIYLADGVLAPDTDNDVDLGTASLEFKDLYLDGTANIDSANIDALTVTVSATFAGATIADLGTVTTVNINGGTFSGDLDGSWSSSNGLEALTTAEVNQLENIGSSTISAAQWGYVGAFDQALATSDAVSFAEVNATTADIDAGTIDNTVIGGTTPAAGTFTAVIGTTSDWTDQMEVGSDSVPLKLDRNNADTTERSLLRLQRNGVLVFNFMSGSATGKGGMSCLTGDMVLMAATGSDLIFGDGNSASSPSNTFGSWDTTKLTVDTAFEIQDDAATNSTVLIKSNTAQTSSTDYILEVQDAAGNSMFDIAKSAEPNVTTQVKFSGLSNVVVFWDAEADTNGKWEWRALSGGQLNLRYPTSATSDSIITIPTDGAGEVTGFNFRTKDTNRFNISEDQVTCNEPLQLVSLTTTERNAESPSNGWIIYNETTHKFQGRANGSWVDLH